MAPREFVKVVNNSGHGCYTKVTDAVTGEEIHGVKSVEIPRFGADDPIVVNLEIMMVPEIKGRAVFSIEDPATGKLRDVKSITFADGETVEF